MKGWAGGGSLTGGAVRGAQVQPRTVGQAGRIGGVNPSDITNLLIHLEVLQRQRDVSRTHPGLCTAAVATIVIKLALLATY